MTKSNTIINKYNGTDYLKATGEIGYGMMNVRDGRVYTDRFNLIVYH